MIKVAELKGYKSLRALNAFHTLMLGLKMLPAYMGEEYAAFFDRVEEMPPDDQRKLIREAALFVELQKEEVESLLSFCIDPNGAQYVPESLKSLTPDRILEMIVAVCMELAKIKIDLVTSNEKKN